jgi:hypothetical protein
MIAGHAIRHDRRRIVVHVRVRHTERLEDIRFRKRAKRLPAHTLHDVGQHRVGAVVVFELAAGREVQPLLTRQEVYQRVVQIAAARRRQLHEKKHIAQPSGVREQVANRHPALTVRPFGDVLAHFVVE